LVQVQEREQKRSATSWPFFVSKIIEKSFVSQLNNNVFNNIIGRMVAADKIYQAKLICTQIERFERSDKSLNLGCS
jgi:hypothetical protein